MDLLQVQVDVDEKVIYTEQLPSDHQIPITRVLRQPRNEAVNLVISLHMS